MKLQGALVREQGVTFGVVVVKPFVIQDRAVAGQTIAQLCPLFGGAPVVLMAQDAFGVPTYYGRRDIADFMASVPVSSVPWREYTIHG